MSRENTPYSEPSVLRECVCCPRNCKADRSTNILGYCKSGVEVSLGSICAHRGEEPVISGRQGICNIFFTHCNMQCVYCQNYDISRNTKSTTRSQVEFSLLVDRIESQLDQGCRSVGFVSPSHYYPQMLQIINLLHQRGRQPVLVYNTNGYDRVEVIRELDGVIDVYLPDFKYMDEKLGRRLSDTPHYPETAAAAVAEMFRQKGADIELDENDLITSGLIIRHLVLPGYIDNSKAVLRQIAENLSPDIHISLMSQYYPTPAVVAHPELCRRLKPEEYDEVLDEFDSLGFHRGWVQQMDSADHYRPDFARDHPFEE
ncbi:MAG: radical SAM protein [candidate division Zixibacteria bacterium]|nr:radical SAM protein [candidate division Zixibacteria bacterium]